MFSSYVCESKENLNLAFIFVVGWLYGESKKKNCYDFRLRRVEAFLWKIMCFRKHSCNALSAVELKE